MRCVNVCRGSLIINEDSNLIGANKFQVVAFMCELRYYYFFIALAMGRHCVTARFEILLETFLLFNFF